MARTSKVLTTPRDPPSESIDWRPLYQRAEAIHSLAPWSWMTEDQMFAVQDPLSGELGVCSIMGMLGEHLAVAVYRGAEGMGGYERLAEAGGGERAVEAFATQNALQLSFDASNELDARDRQVLKALGLKYRGAHAWPRFRSQQPGYLPWHVTPDEARSFGVVLEQVLEVTARVREAPTMLDATPHGEILCRVQREGVWADRRVPRPRGDDDSSRPPPTLDRSAVSELQPKRVAPRRGVWEVDFSVMDGAVQETPGARPCLGYMGLVVDVDSDFIVGAEVITSVEIAERFVGFVVKTMRTAPWLPTALRVRRPEAREWLKPLSAAVETPVELRPTLPVLAKARRSFAAGF